MSSIHEFDKMLMSQIQFCISMCIDYGKIEEPNIVELITFTALAIKRYMKQKGLWLEDENINLQDR